MPVESLQPTQQQPVPRIPKNLVIAIAIVALIGFADATYLAAKFYQGVPPPCSLINGCEIVTTSRYATMFGISVAAYGALYYLTVLVLTLLYLDLKKPRLGKLLLPIAAVGFGFSGWFIFAQLALLKAICLYCMLSAGTSTTLFILSIVLFLKLKSLSPYAKPSD